MSFLGNTFFLHAFGVIESCTCDEINHCQSHFTSHRPRELHTHTHIVRWRMDQSFCYPRMGAFEVFVKKGTQRVEVPVFLATFSQKFQNLATLIHFSNTLTKVTQNIGVFSAVSAPIQPEASLRKVEKALPSEASASAARRKATRGLSRWAVK